MTNYTEKPSWFYKPIQIENLEAIQKEVQSFLYNNVPNLISQPPKFYYVLRESLEPHAPALVSYLKSIGLLDEWCSNHFVTTNYHYKFPIHVDDLDWYNNCYGLNIPIMNCDDTYTVWYDTEIEDDPYFADEITPGVVNESWPKALGIARLIKSDGPPADSLPTWKGVPATEIARWHMKDPAWINVSIPHAPISNHKKFRAVLSLRFNQTNLHDILYNP
jgi:hypothetical protein